MRMNSLLWKLLLFCALCLFISIFLIYPLPTRAATIQLLSSVRSETITENSDVTMKSFVVQAQKKKRPPPPKRRTHSNFWARVFGLGRRGACSNLDPPLLALLPPLPQSSDEKASLANGLESGSALTLGAYPTFWFYVPRKLQQLKDPPRVAEFMLQNENNEDVINKPFRILLNSWGIVSFQLPLPTQERPKSDASYALEVGKSYHWYFSVICNQQRPSRNPSVDGWTERILPSTLSDSQLEEKDLSLERLLDKLYANNIWHETFTLLAKLRCEEPDNPIVNDYWPDMLEALKLKDMDITESLTEEDYCPLRRELKVIDENYAL